MPFRIKTILGVALIEIILVVSLITTGINWLKTSNEAELRERAYNIAEVLAVTAKDAVLSYDLATLEAFATELTSTQGVVYVRIYNQDKLLSASGNADALARPFVEDKDVSLVNDGIYDEETQINESGVVFGKIELGVSTKHLEDLIQDVKAKAPFIAIIGIVLSALFSFMLGTYLTNNLFKLRNAAVAISQGEIGHEIAVTGRDELAQTAHSFNEMSRRLKQTYEDLNHSLVKSQEMAKVLHESELYNHTIIENIADAVISADGQGIIESANSAFEKIFGFKREEVIGKNINILLPDSQRSQHDEYINNFTDANTLKSQILKSKRELSAVRKDGSTFPVEVAVRPIRVDSELMFVALISDITSRKQTENELRNAKLDAEAASKAKSEFLANMSHEIRTPMNGVIGMLQLLSKTPLNGLQEKYVQTASHSADLQMAVINDILDFSKIEAGKLKLESIDFDLREVVENVAELVSVQARNKGLELACYISDNVPVYVAGDPTRLSQVLFNLAGNAVKFTEEGEVDITVELEEQNDNTSRLRFVVKDTGIGIAPEKLAKLFQAFHQADGSTSRRYGGTGLGLTISKQLVELMHGEIVVSSTPGEGSVFSYTVELKNSHKRDLQPRITLAKKRALIVDDNLTNRTVMQSYLEYGGMEAVAAEGAEAALARIAEYQAVGKSFDVIALDMQMPGMDGISLATAIHSNPNTTDVPLVLVSSLGLLENIPKETGIQLCISKPIRQKQFVDCIAKLLIGKFQSDNRETTEEHQRKTFDASVLLVEDNIVNQEVALEMLRLLGTAPVVAENGLDAVETYTTGDFDLILMDCQMPVMDGYEAARQIREYEQKENLDPTPIIALTANAAANDKQKCLASGMDDHLPKPVTFDNLVKALNQWLKPTAHQDLETRIIAGIRENPEMPGQEKHSVHDADQTHIDPEQYAKLAATLGSRLEFVLEKYRQHSKALVETLRTSVSRHDIETVRRTAHALKGSSLTITASRLADFCSQLEKGADNLSQDDAAELVKKIDNEYQNVIISIEQMGERKIA